MIIGTRAFHAGVPRGDYVAHADFNIDVKTYDGETRHKVLQAVEGLIQEEVKAAGITRRPRIDVLATVKDIPYAYWNIGGIDPDEWDDAVLKAQVDSLILDNYSPFFALKLHSTLIVGTDALTLAALTFLT